MRLLVILFSLLVLMGCEYSRIEEVGSIPEPGKVYDLANLVEQVSRIPTDTNTSESIYFEIRFNDPKNDKEVLLTFIRKQELNYTPLLSTYKLAKRIMIKPKHKGEPPGIKFIWDMSKFYIASDLAKGDSQFVASAETPEQVAEIIRSQTKSVCKYNCTIKIVYIKPGRTFHIWTIGTTREQWLN